MTGRFRLGEIQDALQVTDAHFAIVHQIKFKIRSLEVSEQARKI